MDSINSLIDTNKIYLMLQNPYKLIPTAILGLGSAVLAYITLKIYLNRRKYRSIPGPSTRGFDLT